ncbi:MAG: ABC-F family ATP-binding cassette domain-containing protein [Pseudomonadota bacterium]
MMHKPISIKDLGLSFPHKICFENFTTQIHFGSRIAIIGQNGCGKSTVLKILQGMFESTSGSINIPNDVKFGYVPQVIEVFDSLSGGQRLNKAISAALAKNPNVLLLDEPTNHLDSKNRKSLMRMLAGYQGTLIVVSHDKELLRNCSDTLWHIIDGQVQVFSGSYDDYRREANIKRAAIEQKLSQLASQKKDMHRVLMKEQHRASKSKAKGQKSINQRKWPTVVSKAKANRAAQTTGGRKAAIEQKRQNLVEQLSSLQAPEVIVPKFSISASQIRDCTLVSTHNGTVRYCNQAPMLRDITFSISSRDRIAINGDNGSGKSTLIKAIVGNPNVVKDGDWHTPNTQDIGYLDQHYATLPPESTVLESIHDLVPSWSHAQVRRHLNDFLFRKNEEIEASVKQLSGGEKARLSLAQIAACTPKLLILDEVTNNLDLETRQHMIEVLRNYPAALIVISHDEDFLREIGINQVYTLRNGTNLT